MVVSANSQWHNKLSFFPCQYLSGGAVLNQIFCTAFKAVPQALMCAHSNSLSSQMLLNYTIIVC